MLFTDDPHMVSDDWDVRYIEKPENLSEVQFARRIKILGHEYLPEYDFTIWVDGKLQIMDDLARFVQMYRVNSPILAFPHYMHDCAYAEEALCEQWNKGNVNDMRHQIAQYRNEGYPAHNGMIDSCVLVREHRNPDVIRTMEMWWNQIISFSERDQISIGYACWKTGMHYDLVPLYCYENAFFRVNSHK